MPAFDTTFDASFDSGPPTGSSSLPVRIIVGGVASHALPIRVSVVDSDLLSGEETVTDRGLLASVWGVVVEVGGVDVSSSVIGDVVVEAEESAARVADFTLHQPSGTVIHTAEWTGRSVRIWLADMSTGVASSLLPLFFGIVDLPIVTPRSGTLSLRCTDNRQGVIGGLSISSIDTLLAAGRWSPVVFDSGASPWVHANDRLSTIPAALDMSPTGALRLTSWVAKSTADLSFSDDDVLADTVGYTDADRSGMANQIEVNFGYRFPRVKAEGHLISYDYLALNLTSFVYWVRDGNYFLQRAAVIAAIQATGGSVVSVTWIELPDTAQIIPGTGGAPAGVWLPNPPVDVLYCLGFSAVVSFDYAQQNEEDHRITVANAASIAAVGVVREEISGALEGVYDDTVAVEHNILMYRQQMTTIPPKNLAPVVVGLTNSVNGTLTTDSDRAAAESAMECLISIAMTKIHASHRRHSVSGSVPCNPVLDVDKTVSLDAQGVVAKGKVRRVVHRLNPHDGMAISDFDMAICAIAGIGITHPADDVTAPGGTNDGTSNTLEAPEVIWNGLLGDDNVITITFAGVEETERAKAQTVIESTYAAPLYEDLIEITL